MDDFVKHVLKTIGIFCGGILLIYFMIRTTGQRPIGISLLIVNTVDFIFLWLFRLIVAGILGFISFYLGKSYFDHKKEIKCREEEEKKRLENEILDQAQREKAAEEKRLSDLVRAKKEQEERLKIELRHRENEHYLKNRTAEEANEDALKHFL